jgi:adenosylcobinamide kinase/adenosylcobinamide-phosphate guanylyltransferase
MKELILGGARSGKSALAERLAGESGLDVTYIATAAIGDAEMAERIRHHQARRPGHWQVVEEPIELAAALRDASSEQHCVIVDCLTLWLTNLLLADEALYETQRRALLEALPGLSGRVIMVGNETGMGVVPMGELTRRFVDESGRLHQQLAGLCNRVTLTVAGLPHVLKGDPIEF